MAIQISVYPQSQQGYIARIARKKSGRLSRAGKNSMIVRNTKLEQTVAALYDPRLPYHNLGHALDVLAASEELLARCHGEGIRVDAEVVYPALLLHDAGYHQDHVARGFESKEALSADLAASELRRHQYPPKLIEAVQAAILSTRCGAICETIEARVVKAADLSGLAADYQLFLQNSMRLWREDTLLRAVETPWPEWRRRAAGTIERLLSEDLGVSSACYAADGETWLARKGLANIARLREQPRPD